MLIFILLSLINPAITTPPKVDGLTILFQNCKAQKGPVYLAIYTSADAYLNEGKALEKKIISVANNTSVEAYFPNLSQGNYAISCYQDLNNNGKLDKNLLGVPTEPYGFSNNIRPKFRAASWQESRFYIKDRQTTISIRLERW